MQSVCNELNTNRESNDISKVDFNLDLTHACNFNCPYCIEKPAMLTTKSAMLSLGDAKNVIEWFAAAGGKELSLYGGEPTMHPDFPEILLFAAEKLDRIKIVTNGSRLARGEIKNAIVQATERAKVFVRVSLNAAKPDTHALLHGVKGVFPQIITGIREINPGFKRLVTVGISFLICRENINEIILAYQLSGFNGALEFHPRLMTGAHGIGLAPLNRSEKAEALRSITELKRLKKLPNAPELIVPEWYTHWLSGGSVNTEKPFRRCYFCEGRRLLITPPSPGMIYFCTYFRGQDRFRVGSLRDIPFDELFSKIKKAGESINPSVDCKDVLCNRFKYNYAAWRHSGRVLRLSHPLSER